MMLVEELTLKTASLTNVLDWLTQPQGPHLVDSMSTENPLTALAILITPTPPWWDWASCIKLPTYRLPPGAKPISTSSLPLKLR